MKSAANNLFSLNEERIIFYAKFLFRKFFERTEKG
jgi:hypothetical protein